MKTAKFKDSPLGPIPQDWEVKRLGEICDVQLGKMLDSAKNQGEECFYLTNKDVQWGRISVSDLRRMRMSEDDRQRFSLRQGDLLVCEGGEVGRCAIWNSEVEGCCFQKTIHRVRAKVSDTIDMRFLQPLLCVYAKKGVFDPYISCTSIAHLTKEKFELLEIICPPLPEQQRIAEALGEVDKLIESLDEQIEKKRLIAKGVAHDLLSGKKRLPGFKGEWKSGRLGAIGELYGGLSGKIADDFGHGTARFITFLNVLNNVTIDKDMVGEVDVRFGEKQHAVRKGDLFFNVSSETPEEVAMCAVLMEDMPNTYLNSFCCGFRLNKPDHNPLFISYYFNSNIGRDALRGIASGITRYNLSKKAFREKMLVWPEYSEQRAIAEVLSEMDASIIALEAKREKYMRIKEGMMRDLLTGKVRMKGE